MEALIPKLFILTAEASIVLFLILIVIFIFNSKAKRKDLKAVDELISQYTSSKDERINTLKKQLNSINFQGNIDEQSNTLFQQEKSAIKEFVTLYLRRDTYRLLDYPDKIIDTDTLFLKTSGTASTPVEAPETTEPEVSESEQMANATILAREQAESNEQHLKELSELRLKNTELNEHLFEALETVSELMSEHGKKTEQEVDANAQKILDAIIYLRDKRLSNTDPSELAPSAGDDYDQVDSFDLSEDIDSPDDETITVSLDDNDGTLDNTAGVHLGIDDELDVDLDTQSEKPPTLDTNNAINLDDTSAEDDPWADALTEQAKAETQQEQTDEEADPWADALAEQASTEAQQNQANEEDDPWADALAEQADAETQQEQATEEDDPWADALAEQASVEAQQEEADPWADALAEQEKAEKK